MTRLGPAYTMAIGSPATPDAVAAVLTSAGIQGATITEAKGLWRGQTEQTVLVNIAGISNRAVMRLARLLRRVFKQEAVYVQTTGLAFLV